MDSVKKRYVLCTMLTSEWSGLISFSVHEKPSSVCDFLFDCFYYPSTPDVPFEFVYASLMPIERKKCAKDFI